MLIFFPLNDLESQIYLYFNSKMFLAVATAGSTCILRACVTDVSNLK